jgi:VIT1/CCC1 family predicted Fe2+/Mn2+ transporter
MSKEPSFSFWKKLSDQYEPSLRPIDRFAEMIFGLIMVLTFTCSLSAAESGKQEIKTMLWTAVGCNLAWGIVDALMFLMTRMVEKAEVFSAIKKIKDARNDEEIRDSVRDAVPPMLADLISFRHIEDLHAQVQKMPDTPRYSFLTRKEFVNAGIIFLLVFISTFPVIIPFFFLYEQPLAAIRLSNGIAILLLFIAGYMLGKRTGYRRWLTGLVFTLIGVVLVLMTIALGG